MSQFLSWFFNYLTTSVGSRLGIPNPTNVLSTQCCQNGDLCFRPKSNIKSTRLSNYTKVVGKHTCAKSPPFPSTECTLLF